jgi:hypothetical protein
MAPNLGSRFSEAISTAISVCYTPVHALVHRRRHGMAWFGLEQCPYSLRGNLFFEIIKQWFSRVFGKTDFLDWNLPKIH